MDGDGNISYTEFEKFCGEKGSKGEKGEAIDIDKELLTRLRKARVVRKGKLQGEMETADNDINRKISNKLKTKDFENVIRDSFEDVRLSKSDVREISEAFDHFKKAFSNS